MKVLLDTNVLTRSAEPTDNDFQTAVDAVAVLRARGDELCLVPQGFYEFWVVSTRPAARNGRGKTPDEVLVELTFFDAHFTVYADTPAVFAEWRQLMATYRVTGKPAHDARFVAAMLTHRISHILTFNDQDFRRYAGVTAVTPAAVLAAAAAPPTP